MVIFSLSTLNLMIFIKKITYLIFFLLLPGLFIFSCAKIDPVTGEKILIEQDPRKKARDFADKDGGILGGIGIGNKSSGGTFEFASSNVLWRATLKTLEFLPLSNADYSGGIIVYDWYSEKSEREQIKISVRFLSNEVKSDSLQIIGHKKNCDEDNKCITKKIDTNFTEEIKVSIISAARLIKIDEKKKQIK